MTSRRTDPHDSVWTKSWAAFRQTLRDARNYSALRYTKYGLLPVVLLAVEGIARGFDGGLFTLVLPDLVQDLEINPFTIIAALQIAGFLLIFVELGLAYVLDRTRRVPFVAAGTSLSGLFSLMTAASSSIVPIGISRIADGASRTAGTIPRFSLMGDYYPVEHRGKAFALSGVLQDVGTLAAPLAMGYLVVRTSWRVPFVITGTLLTVLGVVLFFLLKEPIRGYMERKAAGADDQLADEPEPPPSFGHAWRIIWGQRTLRRLFIADIFGGMSGRLYGLMFPFFLFQEYRLNTLGRGWVLFVAGIFAFFGGVLAGGVVDRLTSVRPQRVMVFSAALTILASFAIALIAAEPPIWVLYVIFSAFGFASSILGPARSVFFAHIIPAHVRTLGLSVRGLAAIPAVLFSTPFLAQVINWGPGGVLFAAAPLLLLAGLIDMSAAGLFERDLRSAIASQMASDEYRRAKAAGAGKLLVCRDVDVSYDGVQVLFGVDFDVEEGEIIALLGTNGAGKSTLLKAISGVQEASGGAVVFDGRDITHVPPYEIATRGVVHMPGGKGVFPGLTVRENLLLGMWITSEPDPAGGDGAASQPAAAPERDLEEVLDLFPVLRERLGIRAGALSGGEQQMVALAMSFLQDPRLLLIDELSLGLSPAVVAELLESVQQIHARGVTIVVVEQSVNVALTLAERAIFMEKGEVRFFGKTRDLLRRPDILRAVYVKGTGALTEAPTSGLKSERERRRYLVEEAQPVLEVEGLTKSFGGVVAVNDVSFALREGEILGLIGPNGAGKTTIFDLISGYQIPDAGIVRYEGVDVSRLGPDARARLQLVRRFQDARLFPSLTVYEAILVALERRNDVKNMFISALQLPQVRSSERRVRRRADQVVELLDLSSFRDKFVKELSTGLRRITDLACVLAAEPKVLLLDEPSSGIAQAEAESLAPLLRRVRHETGCSILVIEHDMPLISSIADELLALDQGAVVLRGAPDEVLNDQRVIESYLGTSEQVIARSGVAR